MEEEEVADTEETVVTREEAANELQLVEELISPI